MKKSDLKSGMVVELRKGTRFMYINDYLYNEMHEYNISHYNDDLIHVQNVRICDVVKVFKIDRSKLKCQFKNITLYELLTDEFLELIWQRDEVDWSKVPFGTKVRVWDYAGDTKYDGRFLSYCEEHENSFHVFLHEDCYGAFRHCELAEEPISNKELKQKYIKYLKEEYHCVGDEIDIDEVSCLTDYIFKNYNVTRK